MKNSNTALAILGVISFAAACSGTNANNTTSSGGNAAVGGSSNAGSGNVGGSKAGATGVGGGTVSAAGSTAVAGASNSPGCGTTSQLAACNTAISGTAGTGPCTLNIAGIDRHYYVVLPANYNPNTAYPVVTTWPYFSGTAESFLGGYGGAFYGIQRGFPNAIYVTAQGLPQTAGGTDYAWDNANGQDVAFAKAIIATLEANYCVDQNRIFTAGMSYGGIMSGYLVCQAPDIFRAAGIIAGGIFGRTTSCMNHPIAAWFTHGDADATVPFATGEAARDLLIASNGCDVTKTQQVVLTASDANSTCTVYNVCTSGNYPVVWCPVLGGTHRTPSWSATEIAKFFLQF